jgi:hypothetical protein
VQKQTLSPVIYRNDFEANYTRTIYIIVYNVNSSIVENHHEILTPLDETLKRLDYIGLVKGITS